MKKIALILLLGFFALKSFAQAGDLTIGAQGGYITYYKNALYGLNLSYAPSDPLQLTLSGVFNPKITLPYEWNANLQTQWALYSLNLDARFLLLNFDAFATGPSIGVQYLYNIHEYPTNEPSYTNNDYGFNLGWYIKLNLTDNLKLSGGWQYSNISSPGRDYNMFYLGLGWAFNVR
ncbi:hypothetical protein FACS189413_01420 [Bacteroidia bacterium]|nr:hypothetical protein FACS189413_01420 [Bacteroidia bacterium]